MITLRIALLITSLILLVILGLICRYKLNQHPTDKQRTGRLSSVRQDKVEARLYSSNNAQGEDLQLESADALEGNADSVPQSVSSASSAIGDKDPISNLVAELLPVYNPNQLITDYVAVIPGLPVNPGRVTEKLESSNIIITKPLLIFACGIDNNSFSPLSSFGDKEQITHLKLQMHLADKFGSVDKKMLSNFETLVSGLGKELNRETYYAISSGQALNAAQELDEFASSNELIVVLYVLAQPEETFNGKLINQTLLKGGLNYGEFKFFHYSSRRKKPEKIYSVANMYKPGFFELEELDEFSTMGLCAFMVPALQTQPLESFQVMCESLAKISEKLNGILTNQQRELLDSKQYLVLSKQISDHIEQLESRGILPASDLAKQLFD